MDMGVFIPIGNNGWLISTTSPQDRPSFELNKQVVQRAEHHGLDFALSMIKLRGFGGQSEFWDHDLEPFTLMAGLAAVTKRIQLYASAAGLTIPPAIVARMASTIDSIPGGQFGVNIVSGWAKMEYEQKGLWPGEVHFAKRHDYSTEYVTILRPLWEKGMEFGAPWGNYNFTISRGINAPTAPSRPTRRWRRPRRRPAATSATTCSS